MVNLFGILIILPKDYVWILHMWLLKKKVEYFL